MSITTEQIPVTFAGFKDKGTVPRWASAFDVHRSTVAELCKKATLPYVSVIQSTRPKRVIEDEALFTTLCKVLISTSDASARIILGFNKAKPEEIYELAPLLGRIPGLTGRIELVRQTSDLHDALIEAWTKVLATRSQSDPLSDIKSVSKVSRSLRADSGRLDAKKVADAFGLSLTELARQMKLTKQRVSKTPDSEALQTLLRPYERIARLRTVLSDKDFKIWLHTPNEHLENEEAPIDYLKDGASKPLASFAENMLTGSPA